MRGSVTRQGSGPVITARSVRVGDVVHARGGWRTVREMRAYSGGDRLLVFEGHITYRLPVAATLRVRGRAEPAPAPVVWRAGPDPRREAATTHVVQCRACRQQSPPATNPAPLRQWVTAHAALHPAHRTYRHITSHPWHATPTQDTR